MASFLVLAQIAILSAVNVYAGYVPDLAGLEQVMAAVSGGGVDDLPTSFDGQPSDWSSEDAKAQVVHIPIGDPALGVPRRWAYVYTPPGYNLPVNRTKRYPVLYLLHGYPGTSTDWFRAGEAARTAGMLQASGGARAMIIVSPDANAGWVHDGECLNASRGPQLETYLTQTVVHFVEGRYRTITSRDGRAIGGMSAGAYCALNLGLRDSGAFSVIVAIMPYGNPGGDAATAVLGNDARLIRDNSPDQYLPTIELKGALHVFLTAGTAQPNTLRNAEQLRDLLRSRDQDVVLHEDFGGIDNWDQARDDLPYGIVFASRYLG